MGPQRGKPGIIPYIPPNKEGNVGKFPKGIRKSQRNLKNHPPRVTPKKGFFFPRCPGTPGVRPPEKNVIKKKSAPERIYPKTPKKKGGLKKIYREIKPPERKLGNLKFKTQEKPLGKRSKPFG